MRLLVPNNLPVPLGRASARPDFLEEMIVSQQPVFMTGV